jgi:ankyrin repeat protein
LTVVDAADHELIDHLVARGGKLVVPGTDATLYREHGVDPSPINWALLHRRDHLASALLARDSTASNACGAVVYAARYGDAETLARLLALGGDPNSSSADGVSALMAAAFYGETRSMDVLLAQRRIELARTTHSHFNPGHFRIQLEGRSPPLFYGARTALMFAALGGSVEATSLLIAHGAPVHQRDAEGLEAVDYSQEAAVGHLFAGSPPTRH